MVEPDAVTVRTELPATRLEPPIVTVADPSGIVDEVAPVSSLRCMIRTSRWSASSLLGMPASLATTTCWLSCATWFAVVLTSVAYESS